MNSSRSRLIILILFLVNFEGQVNARKKRFGTLPEWEIFCGNQAIDSLVESWNGLEQSVDPYRLKTNSDRINFVTNETTRVYDQIISSLDVEYAKYLQDLNHTIT